MSATQLPAPGAARADPPGPRRPDLALLLAAAAALVIPSWPAAPRAGAEIAPPGGRAPEASALLIDARTAPWYEWTLLEGIGEARARRIVEARAARGGFRSLEDLEAIPGLPRGWSARAAPFLRFPERRAR